MCDSLVKGYNTLTQRTYDPYSRVEVTVDASGINEGDYAGICGLQGLYAAIAVTKNKNGYELVMLGKDAADLGNGQKAGDIEERIYDRVSISSPEISIASSFSCADGKDEIRFYYCDGGEWIELGYGKKMQFMLDHFTGLRYGLYYYSTVKCGGYADFSKFIYEI